MRIGPHKLLQYLGEGGMGTVFLAEQSEPIRRMVALKIVKPGMDSSQVLARFKAERQALALMDHPNIAKVLDAGKTSGTENEPRPSGSGKLPAPLPDGRGSDRPYFVMELVKGVPITEFCDKNKLTTRERLELFIPVCNAIQHAHMKGIIHRDIKPSNVLIALYDGKPVPKVIDFGVAKAMAEPLTQRTLFTQIGQIVGAERVISCWKFKLPNGSGEMQLNRDGTRLAIMSWPLGAETRRFVIWDVASGKELFAKESPTVSRFGFGTSRGFSFSPDGKFLAIGERRLGGPRAVEPPPVQIWHVDDPARAPTTLESSSGADYLLFSPDGARLAAGLGGRGPMGQ
jgi:serine/threonine protein kinase